MPSRRDLDIVFSYDKETEENLRRIDEMEKKYLELYKEKYGHFPNRFYVEDPAIQQLDDLKRKITSQSLPIAITLTSKTGGDLSSLSTFNILPYRKGEE